MHLLEIEFREFQEYEAQKNASRAKLCIKRKDAKMGVVAAYHLGGLLGVDVGCDRWVGKCHQYAAIASTVRYLYLVKGTRRLSD